MPAELCTTEKAELIPLSMILIFVKITPQLLQRLQQLPRLQRLQQLPRRF